MSLECYRDAHEYYCIQLCGKLRGAKTGKGWVKNKEASRCAKQEKKKAAGRQNRGTSTVHDSDLTLLDLQELVVILEAEK